MKKKIKTETRKVPFKNYVITAFMFVGAILLTLYIFKWYQVKMDEKLYFKIKNGVSIDNIYGNNMIKFTSFERFFTNDTPL